MVVTNPVNKIDPNKVKELMDRLGQKSGTAPASEDNKKVKKRRGAGNRGDGSGKPNDPSGGNSPDDIGSNSTKRWHPSSRNTNGTDIPNYPFQTRKSKIRRSKIGKSEVDGISGADIGDINAERFYDYGQYNPSTNPNIIKGDGQLDKKYVHAWHQDPHYEILGLVPRPLSHHPPPAVLYISSIHDFASY